MKIEEAISILKTHNEWRRGAEIPMTDVTVLGEAIDCVVEQYEEKSAFPTNLTWHKVTDGDLPKHFGDYLVIIDSKQFGRRWAIKCWYGYPEDHFSDNTSKGWVLEEDEIVSYWMEIPELPNED